MKKTFLLLLFIVSRCFSQAYHADNKTTTMHTPFRWVVADSAARVNLSVTARDTQKMCFQLADTTMWILTDDSPKRWTWVSGKKADSLWIRTFQAVTAGITRANIDSSKTRHAVADSATIPVFRGNTTFRGNITGQDATYDSTDHRIITADSATFPIFKGVETHRDSSYFASGLRALRLYSPVADIDSMIGDVKIGGSIGQYRGSSYFRLDYNQGSLPGYPSNYYPTLKTDHESLFFSTYNRYIGALTFSLGKSVLLLYDSTAADHTVNIASNGPSYITGSLKVAACTTSSIHSTGTVTATGLQLGSGDLLSVYDTGSFTATASGFTTTVSGTARYTVIGNVVTVYMPQLSGTSNASEFVISGLPAAIQPTTALSAPLLRSTGDASGVCFMIISGSTMSLYGITSGDWPSSGTKRLFACSFSYIKD